MPQSATHVHELTVGEARVEHAARKLAASGNLTRAALAQELGFSPQTTAFWWHWLLSHDFVPVPARNVSPSGCAG